MRLSSTLNIAGTAAALLFAIIAGSASADTVHIDPSSLPRIGKLDKRFVSYNIEFGSITGGRFWKPYDTSSKTTTSLSPSADMAGSHSKNLFEFRPPIDLSNRRLRALAAALGPAYLRVSGTWANSVYFQNNDKPPMKNPPKGFHSVLTRKQWKGLIGFTKAVDAKLLTSFTISSGVRNSSGTWTPVEAAPLLEYTRSIGGKIYAAEMFNEPNLPTYGSAPKGYNAKDFARDEATFRAFVEKTDPDLKIVGPGDVVTANIKVPNGIPVEDLMTATPHPRFDVISYHYYPGVSQRCAPPTMPVGTDPNKALDETWLARTEPSAREHKALRDRYAPGAPIWNTETAGAACGGTPWDATFMDTFRFVDQMGRLAKIGVDVIFHQTLIDSDYGMIDDRTLQPRPNYWAALLWRRLMGPVVLDAGQTPKGLRIYAQCMRDKRGGVGIAAINLEKSAATIDLGSPVDIYALTATKLRSATVLLNGKRLAVGSNNRVPGFKPKHLKEGAVTVAPTSIYVLTVPDAHNPGCM